MNDTGLAFFASPVFKNKDALKQQKRPAYLNLKSEDSILKQL